MKLRLIIFLGIDGTLNDNTWKDDPNAPWITPGPAQALNYILQQTGAQIILTSQRRHALYSGRITLSGFQILLKSHGIAGNVAGYIPYTDNWEDKKFLIKEWLRVNHCSRYVILDDVNMQNDNQVMPEPTIGLTMDNAQDAVAMLQGRIYKKYDREVPTPQPSIGLDLNPDL